MYIRLWLSHHSWWVKRKSPVFRSRKISMTWLETFGFTKSNAKLLTFKLKQWNLLDSSIRVTEQRKRHQDFLSFFASENGLYFCHIANGLFHSIGIPCIPNNWRFLSIVQAGGVSKPYRLTTKTDVYPSLLLLPPQCILKKIMQMSKLFWLLSSMTSSTGK